MGEIIDITGERYGRLVAIEFSGRNLKGRRFWAFQCDCGNLVRRNIAEVRRGNVSSSGCLAKELASARAGLLFTKHGGAANHSKTTEYNAWRAMKQRCNLKSCPQYKDYGGRGIKVCEKWMNDFAAFLVDVGTKPSPELTLERVDNDDGYHPGNVTWAIRLEQARNRRCVQDKAIGAIV